MKINHNAKVCSRCKDRKPMKGCTYKKSGNKRLFICADCKEKASDNVPTRAPG